MLKRTRWLRWSMPVLLLLFAGHPASAVDGAGSGPPQPPPEGGSSALSAEASETAGTSSYYESALVESGVSASAILEESGAGGLPSALHVVEAAGGVAYRQVGTGAWQVNVDVAERPHERVDAVYDLVLALPLPVGFRSSQWRIGVREGAAGSSVPVIYAGEKLSLRRNPPLESSWLPLLVGAAGGLPDLSGTGYAWTLWDTIVRYDASAGPTVQGFGTLSYRAEASLAGPDPADPRNAAYVITWVPTLDAGVPPFAIRLDVVEPPEE
jgi:hypothetical protein